MGISSNDPNFEKINKICNRLQLLLGQWVETIPVISNASASTLISQINLFSTTVKENNNKQEWASHEMAFLLIQTITQLWDKEENVTMLIQCGVINALKEMYIQMAGVLLPWKAQSTDENRFSEFLNLFTTIVSFVN